MRNNEDRKKTERYNKYMGGKQGGSKYQQKQDVKKQEEKKVVVPCERCTCGFKARGKNHTEGGHHKGVGGKYRPAN